jgi:hypothetical protein
VNGNPVLVTPNTIRVSWQTIPGKQYTLLYSPDLTAWLPVGSAYVANGTITEYYFPLTEPTSNFWRVKIDDGDTDGDGVTDVEEIALGLDPAKPQSIAGIPDAWLALNFTDLLLSEGAYMIDPNGDPDGDGISTTEELQSGTNPNSADAAGSGQWITVNGNGAAQEVITRSGTLTIPAGKSAILVVAIASEEFPDWTEIQSQYNDHLEWHAMPSQGASIDGSINVNERHVEWELDVIDGTALPGLPSPVHIEQVRGLTAPPDADLTIQVEFSAMNFSDELLPSLVSVGLIPVEVIIPKLDSNGNQIDGEFVSATELKVAKWEDAFEGTGTNGWVKDDFIGWDKDRFYVRIPGGASMGIEAVKVATEDCPDASYNDDATRIELTASGSDRISDSMILVSDDEDDDYAGSGAGADDQDGDRTHKVQLGGNLVIKSITINGTEHPVDMKVPVPVRKVLPVDFIRMNVAGVRPIAEIEEAVRIVNERYAQVGLRVDATIKELPWPNLPGVQPGFVDLFDEPPGKFIDPLTAEYKSFIDQTDPMGTNIFFLLSAYASNGVALTNSQLQLESGEVSGNYLDKAFVNSSSNSAGYTSAHELAHLLAYRTDNVNDHTEPFWNLLNVTNVNQDPSVLWSKRLSSVQQERVHQHPGIQNP